MTSVASAADLPMKAKAPAVQYVKICSLYGAGYYYIPGTDTCLKIGGHLRVDMVFGPTAGVFESLDYNQTWSRATRQFNTRVRAYATFDARAQTSYGTLRSYFVTGGNSDNGAAVTAYMFRAFIQLAGFTWGLTDSIFDAYSITPFHMNYVAATNGSIGAGGIWQWRYTAQFGGGFSASVAIEEPTTRTKVICCTAVGVPAARVGDIYPDVIGQLQASGTWGRVSTAVAIANVSTVAPAVNRIGWAAMVGGFINVPGMPGDTFGFQVTYAKGATDYVTGNANTNGVGLYRTIKGSTTTSGVVTDATVVGGTLALTTAWGAEVGYEHAWSRQLKTSLTGGYVHLSYTGAAAVALCGAAGCADTSFYNIGSRTQWSPVPNFSLAVDVMYTHMNTSGAGAVAAGTVRGDADIVTGLIRVQRNFWP